MQSARFQVLKQRAKRTSRHSRSLIRSNHHGDFAAAVAPFFNGAIPPPNHQEALGLNGYFLDF